jgi:hypothetical protein
MPLDSRVGILSQRRSNGIEEKRLFLIERGRGSANFQVDHCTGRALFWQAIQGEADWHAESTGGM